MAMAGMANIIAAVNQAACWIQRADAIDHGTTPTVTP